MLSTLEQTATPRFMATLEPQAGEGVRRVRIPLAIAGTWVRGSHKFSITPQDLESIVRNFRERQNGEINADYDHASEMPEVAAPFSGDGSNPLSAPSRWFATASTGTSLPPSTGEPGTNAPENRKVQRSLPWRLPTARFLKKCRKSGWPIRRTAWSTARQNYRTPASTTPNLQEDL